MARLARSPGAWIVLGLILLIVVAITLRGRVRVTVTNLGPDPLSDVVIHVTGNRHPVGDLDVGKSRTVRVAPTSESHVELEFVNHLGHRLRLDAGGYFEGSNYDGIIEIDLEAGAIKRNDHHITLSIW